ncbi:hypothetical protein DXG03_003656 [Asterophora parasitica]|uniref:C2H2-type domain-containing protein n=1 Tax=Asterophora parasitica TaxID=117018 RepID=A0A9P7KDA3_9AGAR|nr:hypothetical protein DXG03_003656 [Asterophora parasitica]
MPRSNRFRPRYGKSAPKQLHPPPMLLPRNPPLLQARFNSPGHSEAEGVATEDAANVAAFETDARHSLTTPIHSPFPSSNPMLQDASWSAPPLIVGTSYDRAPPLNVGSSIASNIAQVQLESQRSESPTSPFSLPKPVDTEYANTAATSTLTKPQSLPTAKKKKSKMHECEVCGKMFPRPSGLKTHMNTHNNLKPFPCGFAGCPRTFTVRSNAKRHLRTHGVDTSAAREPAEVPYVVGFDTPTVLGPSQSALHEVSQTPYKLKWMPPSLTTRTNARSLTTLSDDDSEGSDEEEAFEAEVGARARAEGRHGGWRRDFSITIPFRPVLPSSPSEHDPSEPFEERNSYAEAPLYPYHPSQFRSLPGPAVASPQPNSAE